MLLAVLAQLLGLLSSVKRVRARKMESGAMKMRKRGYKNLMGAIITKAEEISDRTFGLLIF